MPGQRVNRLREAMRDEIALILQRELRDPRVGFASITDVELTPDLQHAKVFVSVLGTDDEKAQTMTALGHAAGYIRSTLGHRLQLRRSPELVFHLDTSIERASRVMRLLREVVPEERSREPGGGDRSGSSGQS